MLVVDKSVVDKEEVEIAAKKCTIPIKEKAQCEGEELVCDVQETDVFMMISIVFGSLSALYDLVKKNMCTAKSRSVLSGLPNRNTRAKRRKSGPLFLIPIIPVVVVLGLAVKAIHNAVGTSAMHAPKENQKEHREQYEQVADVSNTPNDLDSQSDDDNRNDGSDNDENNQNISENSDDEKEQVQDDKQVHEDQIDDSETKNESVSHPIIPLDESGAQDSDIDRSSSQDNGEEKYVNHDQFFYLLSLLILFVVFMIIVLIHGLYYCFKNDEPDEDFEVDLDDDDLKITVEGNYKKINFGGKTGMIKKSNFEANFGNEDEPKNDDVGNYDSDMDDGMYESEELSHDEMISNTSETNRIPTTTEVQEIIKKIKLGEKNTDDDVE